MLNEGVITIYFYLMKFNNSIQVYFFKLTFIEFLLSSINRKCFIYFWLRINESFRVTLFQWIFNCNDLVMYVTTYEYGFDLMELFVDLLHLLIF